MRTGPSSGGWWPGPVVGGGWQWPGPGRCQVSQVIGNLWDDCHFTTCSGLDWFITTILQYYCTRWHYCGPAGIFPGYLGILNHHSCYHNNNNIIKLYWAVVLIQTLWQDQLLATKILLPAQCQCHLLKRSCHLSLYHQYGSKSLISWHYFHVVNVKLVLLWLVAHGGC